MDKRKKIYSILDKMSLYTVMILACIFICAIAIAAQELLFSFVLAEFNKFITTISYATLLIINMLLIFLGTKFKSYRDRK